MTKGTIYTDPFSGVELLLLERGDAMFGIAYDPRRADLPVAWSSQCPHCRAGTHLKVPAHTSREIQLLLSRSISQRPRRVRHYTIPPESRPLHLSCWTTGKTTIAQVIRADLGKRKTLVVTKRPGSPATYEGDRRCFQRPILDRCLHFLLSARRASREEIAACLLPLHSRPAPKRTRGGRRFACGTIDWASIIQESKP